MDFTWYTAGDSIVGERLSKIEFETIDRLIAEGRLDVR